jgi:hypothetical protein
MNALASSFSKVGGGVSIPPLDEPDELEDEVEEVEVAPEEPPDVDDVLWPPSTASPPESAPPVHAAATRKRLENAVDTTSCPTGRRRIARCYCGTAAAAPGCVA